VVSFRIECRLLNLTPAAIFSVSQLFSASSVIALKVFAGHFHIASGSYIFVSRYIGLMETMVVISVDIRNFADRYFTSKGES